MREMKLVFFLVATGLTACSRDLSSMDGFSKAVSHLEENDGFSQPVPGVDDNHNNGQGNEVPDPGKDNTQCEAEKSSTTAGSILINKGEVLTNNSSVTLDLSFPEASLMKLTNNSNCACGSWEPYSSTKVHVLSPSNQLSHISVQYKDYDGAISDCASASITHRDLPTVKIPTTRHLTQNYEVEAQNKVDILFVDDNSGSMNFEQKSMAQRIGSFISHIVGLDYRIAVITTDPRPSVSWGDGAFLPMKGLPGSSDGSLFQIDSKSSLSQTQIQTILGDTLQRSEQGSGSEQGIYGTYRAIERYLDPTNNGPQKSFFRSDASLAVIEISDEDESGNGSKNQAQNLINFVKTTWKDKNFSFNAIITKPNDQSCRGSDGYAYGVRLDALARLTNGIIGSVCEKDYGIQLADIGKNVIKLTKTMELICEPIQSPENTLTLFHNEIKFTKRYSVQGKKLVFEEALPVGKFRIEYQCGL